MIEKHIINSLQETKELAEKIAEKIELKGQVITLTGTLGSGKTYFTSCLINHLLKKENLEEAKVVSPTFNIVKEYNLKEISIFHFDLYRLKNKEELYELDIENCFENGISIIEWPEIAEELIYNISIKINIKILENDKREFCIEYTS